MASLEGSHAGNVLPGMEPTPVQRKTGSSSVGQHYADLGQPAAYQVKKCCICRNYLDYDNLSGYNPFPLCDTNDYESRACNRCNATWVMTARLRSMENDILPPEEAAKWCRPLLNYARRFETAKHLLAVEEEDDKNAALEKFKERFEKIKQQMIEEEKQRDMMC